MVFGLGASALWMSANVPLAHGQGATPTIDVDDIKEGMKGYGLTVFKGTEPERFDVEVIGVLHNFRPSQDLILVRTPHPRLNITKNVRGMSGSPIFLDGKLAGAYAYSWSTFQVEPVAGVTPIKPMITEMRRPIPPGFWPLEGASLVPAGRVAPQSAVQKPHASTTTFDGAPGTYDLETHVKQLAQKLGRQPDPSRPLVAASTPLMLAGVPDHTAAGIRKLFEPLGLEPMQAGGGSKTTPDAPMHFVNGGALGVQLARGDLSMMGLGTTTYADGHGKAAGFGHPMMEGGDSALPTCVGRVLWIFASDQHSSKIGECARTLGTLVQDRMSAIVVDESKVAPVFPIDVKVVGADHAPKTSWHVEVVEERFMSASLAASVLSSVVEATVSEKRDVTWQLKSKLTIRNHGTIELDDFGVAIGGTPEVPEFFHTRLVRALGDVLNNPWENTRIDKIESTMSVEYTRDVWRLRGVELLDPIVDAGEKARVRVTLVPHVGPEVTRTFEVRMPPELAGKDVDVEVVPGWDVPLEVSAPESLAELLVNETRQSLPPKSLVLQYRVPGQGVTYNGHIAGRLPSFALDSLRPSTTDAIPDTYPVYARSVTLVDKYVEGRDKVRIKVRPLVR
jgi:hypothetical protein